MSQTFDAIGRIQELCRQRGYSYYELAKRSNIAYSTLNTLILKKNTPTLSTIEKLCDGFGITLLQFFDPTPHADDLSEEQQECMELFCRLSPENRRLAVSYMQGLSQKR
jgi:transcriptional regulator with XRE-family HTH domain